MLMVPQTGMRRHVTSTYVNFFIDTSNLKSEFFKRSFGNLRADLKYIEENMDLLESSGDRRSIEGLLLELMTCTDVDDDEGHLQQLVGTRVSLTQLLRMVAKLKQLVPPKLVKEEEEEEEFPRLREQDLPERDNDDITPQQLQNLRISYESLTEIQRNCLLYFAAFGRFGNIHERILIQLWYGEGFIDPVSYACSKGVENPNTIEENGRQVLKVLLDKGFIERSETVLWSIDSTELRFVRRMAKAAHFFDLDDNKNGLPTPRFSGDLHVLDQMKSLYSLKITWKRNYNIDQEPQTMEKGSRWRKLKCWEQVDDTEGQLRSNRRRLCSLKKLALRCFPLQDAPKWLNPSELQNLEKLYIMGGSLKTLLSPDINQSTWNVKTLNLRYLRNLEINWEELRHIFPHMTRFLREGVDGIKGYPGGSYIRDREWEIADEQK